MSNATTDLPPTPAAAANRSSAPLVPVIPQREKTLAVSSAFSAYLIWGVVGWYFQIVTTHLIGRVVMPGVTLLAQRAVWSLLFICVVLAVRGELAQFAAAVKSRRLLLGLTATSLLIATNWLTFIYAASSHLLVQASVGYFISPLMTVLLGVILLGERLRRGQTIAIITAAAGVAMLVAAKAGIVWIPIALTLSWSFYVLLRKRIPVGPMVGLGVETAILTPLALAYIGYDFGIAHAHLDAIGTALLAAAGVITALPLIMFAYGARRLTMATLGLTQYIGPTVQFIVAAIVLGEPLTRTEYIGFSLIWCGLIIFTIEGYRAFRRAQATPALAA